MSDPVIRRPRAVAVEAGVGVISRHEIGVVWGRRLRCELSSEIPTFDSCSPTPPATITFEGVQSQGEPSQLFCKEESSTATWCAACQIVWRGRALTSRRIRRRASSPEPRWTCSG
jgi:hypothetical protein